MARKATGSVIEPKDGRGWAIRFRAYGKRRYVALGASGERWSREKAEAELRHVLADVERGIWKPHEPAPAEAPAEVPTFHVFASEWLAARELDWRPSTAKDARWALELHLLPAFAELPLSEITAERVDRYAHAKRREGSLSANSVNKTLHYLSTILDLAVDYEHISRNPAKGKKRRLPGEPRRRSWVEPEQLVALLDACNPTFRPLVATLAGGGLRIGEAIALTWADVNLASGTIRVTDAKTAAGVRTVDMPLGLSSELRTYKARSSTAKPTDPVFRKKRSKGPQNVRNAQSRLKHAIKLANIELVKVGIEGIDENVTPHSLRRAYASLRFGAGDDPVYVAEQLGHTRATFSMDVYARAIKRRERLAGEQRKAFDAALEWAAMGSGGHLGDPAAPAIPLAEPLSAPKRG